MRRCNKCRDDTNKKVYDEVVRCVGANLESSYSIYLWL